MNVDREEMTKTSAICTKHETKYLRSSNDMRFCDQIYHKTKQKKGTAPFRRTNYSKSFEQKFC